MCDVFIVFKEMLSEIRFTIIIKQTCSRNDRGQIVYDDEERQQ